MPKHSTASIAGVAQDTAPGDVITNEEDRELAAMIARDEAATHAPPVATASANPSPAGGVAPPVGGSPPAPVPSDGVLRFQGVPVLPFSLTQAPDVSGQVVLHEPQTIAMLARLADVHAAAYAPPEPGTPRDAPRRIDRQFNVWLTDRRQIVMAGLLHTDADGCWHAQVFPGTKTNYPRHVLG